MAYFLLYSQICGCKLTFHLNKEMKILLPSTNMFDDILMVSDALHDGNLAQIQSSILLTAKLLDGSFDGEEFAILVGVGLTRHTLTSVRLEEATTTDENFISELSLPNRDVRIDGRRRRRSTRVQRTRQ